MDRQGPTGEAGQLPSRGGALPDRYEDRGLIARGGMGEVRRVYDSLFNRVVAMKIIRQDVAAHGRLTERFLEEALATAQLEHPGIVPVYERGILPDGRLFFTMKEVRGHTLQEVISRVHHPAPHGAPGEPEQWTFRRLIDYFRSACEAVAYAHSRGVMHRDLKPANIMIGSFGEVLVLDWGLARLQSSGAWSEDLPPVLGARGLDAPALTAVGTVAGTPAYMPPEQARGAGEALGPTADVYSLGAILYEILAGRPPYVGAGPQVILAQVISGPPPPPGALAASSLTTWTRDGLALGLTTEVATAGALAHAEPAFHPSVDVPSELRTICERAMAREPGERYPSALELVRDISTWQDGDRRREQALERVKEADELARVSATLREEAQQLQRQAAQALAGLKPFEPAARKRDAWEVEDRARELELEAELREVEYVQRLRLALTEFPELPEALERLAAHHQARHAAAEERGLERERVREEALLRACDRGAYSAYLQGDGRLSLLTEPEGAQVTLHRYELRDRRLELGPPLPLGVTPLIERPLPMGSYMLVLTAPGREVMSYPICITRQHHWACIPPGGDAPRPVQLLPEGALEEGECLVPEGWFTLGSRADRERFPVRRCWIDSFVIQRHPVTNRQYLAFLNDVLLSSGEAEALRYVPRERGSLETDLGTVLYARAPSGEFILDPHQPEPWNPDWPVFMVDWPSAMAYAAWWSGKTGEPWRLPLELEWEKAARGVDGRIFPWGDFLNFSWAAISEAFDAKPFPTPIFSFPTDEGPYGVRGTVGNVRDWCLDRWREDPLSPIGLPAADPQEERVQDGSQRALRGGCYGSSSFDCRPMVRMRGHPNLRDFSLGFRLVRSLRGGEQDPPVSHPR